MIAALKVYPLDIYQADATISRRIYGGEVSLVKGPGGLLIIGTGPECGKTVVLTGLSATLREEGFGSRAIKPIHLGPKSAAFAELNFISAITHTPLNYPVQYIDTPGSLALPQWAEAIKTCNSGTELVLAELPGSSAIPLCKSGEGSTAWRDPRDFAKELGWPCLLVGNAAADACEKLILNASYLQRHCQIMGMVLVETISSPPKETWLTSSRESLEISLQERTSIPFLGCLRYSPSISVEKMNQGNLIKTTSAALDLLPIIRSLDLRISV